MNTLCQAFASNQEKMNGKEAMMKYITYTHVFVGQLK